MPVLCVDEEPAYATLVATRLSEANHRIDATAVTDPREALDHVSTSDVACVVSEYAMPGLDGLELLDAVRTDRPNLPFVLLTGSGDEAVAARAISAGVTDYVRKADVEDSFDGLADTILAAVDEARDAPTSRESAARERYAAAFADAMDALVVLDDDMRVVDANERARELTGTADGALAGRRFAEFTLPAEDFEDVWQALQREGTAHGTIPFTSGADDTRQVEYRAKANFVPGEHLVVLRDVTARTRLESQLRAEEDALQEMYRITADPDRSFEEKIAALLALGTNYLELPYGFMTRIEEDTQTIVESVGDHELLQAGSSCPLSDAYCRKTVAEDQLLAVQDAVADGWEDDPAYERFGLGAYIGSRIDVDGALYGTFCFAGTEPRTESFTSGERAFVELLTRWAHYELVQRRNTAKIRDQNDRLEEFASVVSHDLRNPINVADGFLDLAREDGDPEHFDRVQDALDRMDRIVTDLLALAQTDANVGDIERVDLAATVRDAWATVETGSARLVVDDDLGTVLADRTRLQQLFENLFRNSVEHGAPPADDADADDEHSLTVRVTATANGFAVTDDGPGIPEADRDRVFDRGFTTSEDGTGFGLSIVQNVVAGHGWTVEASESESGGARFDVTDVVRVEA